ncbi:MAG TPA: hypothetical protein VI933_04435 [archaeon]|nr:hypothetical protein [archaeon]
MKNNGGRVDISPDGDRVIIRRQGSLPSTYWRENRGFYLKESHVEGGMHTGLYVPMWNPSNGGC